MKRLLLIILSLAACGDNEQPYTWGDVAFEVSGAYCTKMQQCGVPGIREQYGSCYRHSVHHLCELNDTCDVELPSSAQELTRACVKSIPRQDCAWLVYFGLLPAECTPVFEYRPDAQQ